MEQSHLHGQSREFRIRNKAPKRRKMMYRTVIIILSSLAYITPIRLSFCISTTKQSLLDRGREREREFL